MSVTSDVSATSKYPNAETETSTVLRTSYPAGSRVQGPVDFGQKTLKRVDVVRIRNGNLDHATYSKRWRLERFI